jgi:hypothetical protein
VFGILMLSSARGFSGVASPDGDLHGRAVSKGSNKPSGEASSQCVPELQRGAELQDDVSALQVGDGGLLLGVLRAHARLCVPW